MDGTAYQQSLTALLPPGLAWPRDPESVLGRLLAAWADELARVDGRAADLLEEADPRTTAELLDDWGRAYGLPDACAAAVSGREAARQALLAKITARGGQTPAYYLAIAQALGLDATLTEFATLHDVTQDVGAALIGEAWAYAWTLHLGAVASYPWQVDGRVDEPLNAWTGNAQAACMFSRLKPAHTICILSYGG